MGDQSLRAFISVSFRAIKGGKGDYFEWRDVSRRKSAEGTIGDTVVTGRPLPVASAPVSRSPESRGKLSVPISAPTQGCLTRKRPSPLPPSKSHLSLLTGRFNPEFSRKEIQENVPLDLSPWCRREYGKGQ